MRNLPLAGAEERWGRLCLKQLSGIQKLHRKRSREPAKQRLSSGGGGGGSSCRSSHAASAGGEAGASDGAPEGGEAEAAARGAFPTAGLHQQRPSRKDACGGPLRLSGAGGGQPFPDPSLPPPRVMACRPLESPFPPVSRVTYGGGGGGGGAEPSEAAGASPEIRAIQQTRRLLANARERTRVHTISAAFEALRKQVPCYSYGQKLSKLAILRIACNYILSLARLANLDYSADHSNMSFSECVEQCTRTLQAEGRSKKRKQEIMDKCCAPSLTSSNAKMMTSVGVTTEQGGSGDSPVPCCQSTHCPTENTPFLKRKTGNRNFLDVRNASKKLQRLSS